MMNPGIYENISNAEYHGGPGLSASGLKLLAWSPAHYKYAPREETPAMREGTAIHSAVFEPERFAADYVAVDMDKRTKAGKEAWSDLEQAGKIVVTRKDYEKFMTIANVVQSHPLAGRLVSGGTAERSVFWRQGVTLADGGETEILCKCRPDYMKDLGGGYVVVDLKTTTDARPAKWARSAYWDYGYHIQAAHYANGLRWVLGERPREFFFIVVEKTPPYGVIIYRTTGLTLTRGYEDCDGLYETYAECLRADAWPNYPEAILDFDLPKGA
jgi:exodeoxyribonuclease VIII